jgi:hypothetical protein
MIRRTPISFASGLTGNASTPKIADVVASGFFGGNDRHTVGAKLRMRPIRLHLDTSDYAAMYQATLETPQARVRDELRELAQSGRIEIGLSYHVVFELLQKAEPNFREDRLARARLLTELCGRNAFPYPTDLGQGLRFSTEGLWVPRIDLADVEVERVVEHVMQAMARHPELNRHERRALSKRKYFTRWVSSNPAKVMLLVQELWPLKFGRAFVEGGDLNRYLLGEMTRSDANRKLWFYITDPVTVYEGWFEQYGRDDPIAASGPDCEHVRPDA